jgi:hypothetical protein
VARPVINVIMDLSETEPFHAATFDALDHASRYVGVEPDVRRVPTAAIDAAFLADVGDAVLLGPGTPYTDPWPAEEVIGLAREREVAFVAT